MPKINELKIEARVISEPRKKELSRGVLSDWLCSLYAGKNKDGQHQSIGVVCKHWSGNAPSKGMDIIIKGRLSGEKFTRQDGSEVKQTAIIVEEWSPVGSSKTINEPVQSHEDLPF